MGNLIEEVGTRYFKERWPYCMFFNDKGEACLLETGQGWPHDGAIATVVDGSLPSGMKQQATVIPHEFFKDQEVFKTPHLGWREADNGKYMVYLRRNNYKTFRRGVSYNYLNSWRAPSTTYLSYINRIDERAFTGPKAITLLVMKPRYTEFRKGVEDMRNGKSMGFAVNCNVAVIPDVKEQQAIYFNTNKVGIVRPDNTLHCEVPAVRSFLREYIK